VTYTSVKQSYTDIFREYGLPDFIHSDNGSPFGNTKAICRYTRLCYWLIDQGIVSVFSDPASPQQKGRHKRMHRDLKAYGKKRIETTLSKQQGVMDNFRIEYNEVRPHEALNMQTPATSHTRTKKLFNEKATKYDYDFHTKKIIVYKNGTARWGAYHCIFISRGAIGRYVGEQETGDGIWNVYYRNVLLGYFDERDFKDKEQ